MEWLDLPFSQGIPKIDLFLVVGHNLLPSSPGPLSGGEQKLLDDPIRYMYTYMLPQVEAPEINQKKKQND